MLDPLLVWPAGQTRQADCCGLGWNLPAGHWMQKPAQCPRSAAVVLKYRSDLYLPGSQDCQCQVGDGLGVGADVTPPPVAAAAAVALDSSGTADDWCVCRHDWPSAEEWRPAAQAVHVDLPEEACERPSAQCLHTALPAEIIPNFPAGHAEQSALALGVEEEDSDGGVNCPSAQTAAHANGLPPWSLGTQHLKSVLETIPAAHTMHSDCLYRGCHWPSPHVRQAPLLSCTWPYLPAGQGMQKLVPAPKICEYLPREHFPADPHHTTHASTSARRPDIVKG
jgi:hypothetical protein